MIAKWLKTLDTFSNCQRPVFSLGVSQHKITFENLNSIGHRSCEIIMEKKKLRYAKLCPFICLISRPQNLIRRSRNQIRGNYFFLKNYITSGSPFSQCFILGKSLPMLPRKVVFYINYIEFLPIVSTAFKLLITKMGGKKTDNVAKEMYFHLNF